MGLEMMPPSSRVAELAVIYPVSATVATGTAWVLISGYEQLEALIAVGVIASTGTVDAKIQQATDSSGTGAKDVTGKSLTQLTQAGGDSGKRHIINVAQQDFDVNNGFAYARVLVTPATAAALIFCELRGFNARFPVVHDATTIQVIGG